MKTCSKCKISKEVIEFYVRSESLDGRNDSCKDCDKRDRIVRIAKLVEGRIGKQSTYSKVCTKCRLEKEISSFSKNAESPDGYKAACKACAKTYKQENAGKLASQRHQPEIIKRDTEKYGPFCKSPCS